MNSEKEDKEVEIDGKAYLTEQENIVDITSTNGSDQKVFVKARRLVLPCRKATGDTRKDCIFPTMSYDRKISLVFMRALSNINLVSDLGIPLDASPGSLNPIPEDIEQARIDLYNKLTRRII